MAENRNCGKLAARSNRRRLHRPEKETANEKICIDMSKDFLIDHMCTSPRRGRHRHLPAANTLATKQTMITVHLPDVVEVVS